MRLRCSWRVSVTAALVRWLGVSVRPGREKALSFGGQAIGAVATVPATTTTIRVATRAVVTVVASLSLVASASAQGFGGYATGAQVTVPTTGTTVRAASGSLPPTGGTVEASLLTASIPSTLTGGAVSLSAGTMHSAAVGLTATDAEASQESVNLTISSNQITADFLMAHSTASCGPAVAGSSQITNLVVNGQTITVTGGANQTVALPNGALTINEQTPNVGTNSATLTVTALHVTTYDSITGAQLADAMLSTVQAEIQCPVTDPGGSSTTGGGWIPVSTGKGTFGFVGAVQPDASVKGHIVYIDHTTGYQVQSTMIQTVSSSTCSTQITATGTDNVLGTVSITVNVTDGGAGGTNDMFSITTDDYTAGPTALGGGNIQVHKTCPQ